MKLYGCSGCGSTVIEVLLELAGVAYERDVFAWEDQDAWARLRTINPKGQVPTLVLDDGTILTESAALALWIAEARPEAGLLPTTPRERALAYGWIVHFATAIYEPIVIGDFPERWVDGEAARTSLKAHALERAKRAWLIVEERVEPSPYLLGPTLSVVDVYAAMLTHWRPGRAWFEAHCPNVMKAVRETEAQPVVASVWARNFT